MSSYLPVLAALHSKPRVAGPPPTITISATYWTCFFIKRPEAVIYNWYESEIIILFLITDCEQFKLRYEKSSKYISIFL